MAVQVAVAACSKNIRRHSVELEDFIPKKRPRYFYKLASESSEELSDGSVSALSVQNRSTDFAKDTSDTSTSSSSESLVEYEIDTGSDIFKPCPLGEESTSSPEDIPKIEEFCRTTSSGLGLMSNSDKDTLIEQEDFAERSPQINKTGKSRICIRCGSKASILYCDSCFKARKNFFPPRPKRRRKIIQDDVKTVDSGVFCEMEEDNNIKEHNVDIEPNKELCGTCMLRPKNAGYIHKNIVHVYSCYKCSVRTLHQIGRCPICNVRVKQICKIVFA